MKKSETQSKLKRIPFYKIWWNRWFVWRGIPLPMVRRLPYTDDSLFGVPKTFTPCLMDRPTGLLFYLDYELKQFHRTTEYLDKAIDHTAQKITSGLI
jgi:hypothetical protein